jgi:N-acetylglucosamine-6-sulfatase
LGSSSRRRRLLAFLLLAVVVGVPQIAGAVARAGRPDIVVVMVDDLGAIDERILDRLPNIRDLFLRHGLRFDQAFTETPLCCPARASFLTGQHTRNHGVIKNRARLLDDSHTIATALHDSGYWTILAGKYLNHSEQLADKTPDGWDRVAMLNTWSGNLRSDWWINGRPTRAGYNDRNTLRTSLRWLHAAPADKPVFMWVTPRAPHWGTPLDEPAGTGRRTPWRSDVEARYKADPRCDGLDPWKPVNYDWSRKPDGFPLGQICRSMLTVDEMVGKLRAEMAAQGRNPTWMFTSDNGMAWGVDGYPLKNVPEAGRVPLYFAGRDVVQGSTNALVSNIDFGPTLADLAGTSMRWADGVSFAPVLSGEPGGRSWMLEDHPRGGYSGRGWTGPWWGIRTPDWHLVEWHGTHLYNLRVDRYEQHDVHQLYSSVSLRLMAIGRTLVR